EAAPLGNGSAQGRRGQNRLAERHGGTRRRSADVGASEPRETRGRLGEGPGRDPRGTSGARSGPKGIGGIPKRSRRDTPRAGHESEGDRGCRSRARSWPSGRLGARKVPLDDGGRPGEGSTGPRRVPEGMGRAASRRGSGDEEARGGCAGRKRTDATGPCGREGQGETTRDGPGLPAGEGRGTATFGGPGQSKGVGA